MRLSVAKKNLLPDWHGNHCFVGFDIEIHLRDLASYFLENIQKIDDHTVAYTAFNKSDLGVAVVCYIIVKRLPADGAVRVKGFNLSFAV